VQGRWRGVTVGCAAGRNPGLAAAAFNGAGGAPLLRNSRRAGTPCGASLIAAVRPACDAGKSEGEGQGPDRGQHVVRSSGSATDKGPAVLGSVADQRGKMQHVARDDFEAPRSALGLGKRRPREGAGGC
jgi:hypothetical protein